MHQLAAVIEERSALGESLAADLVQLVGEALCARDVFRIQFVVVDQRDAIRDFVVIAGEEAGILSHELLHVGIVLFLGGDAGSGQQGLLHGDEVRTLIVDPRPDPGLPQREVLDVPLLRLASGLLQAHAGGEDVVRIPGILAGVVAAQEPLAFLPDLKPLLPESHAIQSVAVLTLIHRAARAVVGGCDHLHAIGDLVVQRSTCLQVVGPVVNQILFAVTRSQEEAKAGIGPAVEGVVAEVIVHRHILIAVDVHGIEAAGISRLRGTVARGAVVLRIPILGPHAEHVQLVGESLLAILVLENLRPAHRAFEQSALAALGAHAQAGEGPRALGGHAHHAVECAGAIVGRAGSGDHIHLHHVEVARAEEVAEREVEAGALVVHAVDQLQGAHGAGAVEAARVEHLEAHARRGHVHALEGAEALVEVAAGRFADGDHVHALHREGRLFLLLADPAAHHFGLTQQHLIGAELQLQFLVEALHHQLQLRVADVADHQGIRRQLAHQQLEPPIDVRHGADGGALQHHVGADEGLARGAVAHRAAQLVLLGMSRHRAAAARHKEAEESAQELSQCGHAVGGCAGKIEAAFRSPAPWPRP